MKSLYVEPTNICNKRCSFCFQSTDAMTREKGLMTAETFQAVLDNAKGYNQLILHHSGEPMLHPQIHEFAQAAKEAGYHVALTTNGTKDISRLADIVDEISISFGEKPHADIVVNDIGNWVRVIHREKTSWGGVVDAPKRKLRTLGKKLLYWLGYPLCTAPETAPAVLWDGTIVPCCMDFNADLKLGNIHGTDIGEATHRFAKALKKSIPQKCRACKGIEEAK